MTTPDPLHPAQALYDPDEAPLDWLPVCDHYAGVAARMQKSLQLQARMGPVFDVTLDNEDGAPVGGEVEHAHLIAELLASADNRFGRVGVRLLPAVHPRFADVLKAVLKNAPGPGSKGHPPAYLMVPKPRHLTDLQTAVTAIDHTLANTGHGAIPVHVLIETHGALQDVQAIAAHPRVQSLSFGLMDFVSAHRGAIPQTAMQVAPPAHQDLGQFDHPLVLRAKLAISAACHAAGKTPSHCVVTEFNNPQAVQQAAQMARNRLGYTRMWSIHPSQIEPIVKAFTPDAAEIEQATRIIGAAQRAFWAPIQDQNALHDRASYRYFWQVLQRAHRTGALSDQTPLTSDLSGWFETPKQF